MGTKFLTKEKAALILGVSSRTVYRYLAQGLLIPAYDGRRIGVWEEDALKLKKIQQQDIPTALDRELFLKMVTELETLKSQMSAVMRILNIKYEHLNLTDPEYRTLNLMAEQYSLEGWPPQAEEQWADTFVRLRIEDLENLERVTKDPHPWRVLLRLATTMHLNTYDKSLQDQMAAGKNNIYQTAGIWCVLKGESPKAFTMMAQRDGAPIRKLMRRLEKSRNGTPS